MEGGNIMNSSNPTGGGMNSLTNNSFIQHVTRFDNDTKTELSNVIQYLIIAIIPIYLLNKTLIDFMPSYDQNKGNIEVLGEIVIQNIALFLGIYIINRIVCYLPTFSGENMSEINLMNIVLLIVFISINSENGKKLNLVYERLIGSKENFEDEKEENKKDKKDKSKVTVSQPLQGGAGMTAPMPTHQPSQADYLTTHDQMTQPQNQVVQAVHNNQQRAAFGPMGGGMAEPMAANEGFGAFSSF